MTTQHYLYTLERLRKLIYILTVDEENIKKRLIKSLMWWTTSEDAFPPHLTLQYQLINKIICCKPKDEYNNSYSNSLRNKHLKTCSIVATMIVDLEIMLSQYLEEVE